MQYFYEYICNYVIFTNSGISVHTDIFERAYFNKMQKRKKSIFSKFKSQIPPELTNFVCQ